MGWTGWMQGQQTDISRIGRLPCTCTPSCLSIVLCRFLRHLLLATAPSQKEENNSPGFSGRLLQHPSPAQHPSLDIANNGSRKGATFLIQSFIIAAPAPSLLFLSPGVAGTSGPAVYKLLPSSGTACLRALHTRSAVVTSSEPSIIKPDFPIPSCLTPFAPTFPTPGLPS